MKLCLDKSAYSTHLGRFMAQHDHTQFLELLHRFLPAAALTALAKAHGWLERQREFEPVMMVWTLSFGLLWRRSTLFGRPAPRLSASLGLRRFLCGFLSALGSVPFGHDAIGLQDPTPIPLAPLKTSSLLMPPWCAFGMPWRPSLPQLHKAKPPRSFMSS